MKKEKKETKNKKARKIVHGGHMVFLVVGICHLYYLFVFAIVPNRAFEIRFYEQLASIFHKMYENCFYCYLIKFVIPCNP